MEDESYDPREREAEKRSARERDEADLASGRITAAELQARNRFLKGLDPVAATIRKWKRLT